MREVVLLDSNPKHCADVSNALMALACHTIRCPDIQSAITCLERKAADVAIVVPHPPEHWRTMLAEFREAMRARGIDEPARIICLLTRPYCGPEERVYAARRGYRVMYEG